MDAPQIPFENEFDAIAAFDVLEHIKEDDVVLAQMHQTLRRKCGMILTVLQHLFYRVMQRNMPVTCIDIAVRS